MITFYQIISHAMKLYENNNILYSITYVLKNVDKVTFQISWRLSHKRIGKNSNLTNKSYLIPLILKYAF